MARISSNFWPCSRRWLKVFEHSYIIWTVFQDDSSHSFMLEKFSVPDKSMMINSVRKSAVKIQRSKHCICDRLNSCRWLMGYLATNQTIAHGGLNQRSQPNCVPSMTIFRMPWRWWLLWWLVWWYNLGGGFMVEILFYLGTRPCLQHRFWHIWALLVFCANKKDVFMEKIAIFACLQSIPGASWETVSELMWSPCILHKSKQTWYLVVFLFDLLHPYRLLNPAMCLVKSVQTFTRCWS